MLLQNEQLLTNILDYLPLVEKIFKSEETIEIFSQVAKIFQLVDEYEDWENVEKFIKSVQSRNGFDNYIDIK